MLEWQPDTPGEEERFPVGLAEELLEAKAPFTRVLSLLASGEPLSRVAPAAPPQKAAADCQTVLAETFVPAIAGSAAEWRFSRIAAPPEYNRDASGGFPVAERAVAAQCTVGSDSAVTLRGMATRVGSGVALAAHIEYTGSVRPSTADLAASLLSWPEGSLGQAVIAETELCGGVLWTHLAHPERDDAEGWAPYPGPAWPRTVRAWSNGEWLLLAFGVGPGLDRLVQVIPPPYDFLLDAEVETEGVGARLKRSRESGGRPGVTYECVAEYAPDIFVWPPASAGAGEPPLPVLAPAATGMQVLPREALLAITPQDEWENAEPAPVPATVSEVLSSLPPDASTLTLRKRGGETVGLLRAGGYGGSARWDDQTLVQWRLTGGSLGVTVMRAAVRRTAEYREDEVRQELLPDLPFLFGDAGRSVARLPLAFERTNDPLWWKVTVDPETRIGYPEQYRLGDTSLGRTVIYAAPSVIHILFDLPEGEATE